MKTKNIVLKIGKILLVFCTLFSQLSFSLEAFAEEVINDDVSTVEESNEVTVDDETDEEENIVEDTDTDDDTVLEDDENSGNDNDTTENEEDNTDEDTDSLWDVNIDGVVDESDVEYIIDDILNNEEESSYDVADATYVNAYVVNGEWAEVTDVVDVLGLESSSDANVLVGDTFELKLVLSGFEEDFINGIQGIVNYDESLLELQDISAQNVVSGYKNEEGKFVYLLEDYNNSDDVLLTFTFVALAEGETIISINDVVAARNGAYVSFEEDNNSIETVVSIAPLGMGGDDEELVEETTTTDAPVVVNTVNVVNAPKVTYVVLSSNNYINSLKIKGYDIDFDKYTYEYDVTVGSDVKSLNLDIVLDSAYATYVVNGNENFKTGKNVVEIVVTAEDGESRTYTINVTKKAKEQVKEESKEKSNVSRIVIIVLIILVIIGLIYVIFKDDEEDSIKEEKKTDSKKKNNTKKKK